MFSIPSAAIWVITVSLESCASIFRYFASAVKLLIEIRTEIVI